MDSEIIDKISKTNRFSSFLGLALIIYIRDDLVKVYILYNIVLRAVNFYT